ncbi:MAG TPA: hypothetical protein VKY40_02265, partial [Halanaerobiales bacterium]|nr:hypothetical protein [Halanaerobiales bacterium]
LEPNPFTIETYLKNEGGSTLYDVSVELVLPPGLILASKEKAIKYPMDIEAGEELRIKWKTRALQVEGKLPFAINIEGLHGYKEIKRFDDLDIPSLQPYLYLEMKGKNEIKASDYITMDIIAENIQEIELMDTILEYNPEALKPVYVSRGTVFLKDNQFLPWNKPELEESGIILFNQRIPDEASRGTLGSIHFKVLDPDQVRINWGISRFIGNGQELGVILKDFKLE